MGPYDPLLGHRGLKKAYKLGNLFVQVNLFVNSDSRERDAPAQIQEDKGPFPIGVLPSFKGGLYSYQF